MSPRPGEPPPVAWITGASGGLGQALTEVFLRAGWRVAAGYSRNAIARREDAFAAVALDVSLAISVERARDEILAAFGRVDVLVNNAGIASDALLHQMDEEEWDRVLDVDLKGAFLCARAVLPGMVERRDGHLVQVGSWSGRTGAIGQANYAAAKAGLVGLSASLAREGGPHGVRSNTVLPGVLPTGMTAGLPPERLTQFAQANALGRINSLPEVAEFILHLAAMENVSGQVFQLDSRIGPWT